MNERPGRDHEFFWAVDPIDGTTNFVNGFPIFAASIGVLHNCRPVVGARLVLDQPRFAFRRLSRARRRQAAFRRRRSDAEGQSRTCARSLAGVPVATAEDEPWETRKTGSAAIECALVAAGLMQVARFNRPNLGRRRRPRAGRSRRRRGAPPRRQALEIDG